MMRLAGAALTADTPRSAGRLGAILIVLTLVASEIISIPIGNLGGVAVTFQLALGALLLPIGLIIMGKVQFTPRLLGTLFASAAVIAWPFVAGPAALADVFPNLVNLVTALVMMSLLYTALNTYPDKIETFVVFFVLLGCISAVVTALQAFEIVSLFGTTSETAQIRYWVSGYARGLGFQSDPNFQAQTLSIALGLTLFCLRSRLSLILIIVLLAGIYFTYSRMGILIAGSLIGLRLLVDANGRLRISSVALWSIVVLTVVAAFGIQLTAFDQLENKRLLGRFDEVGDAIKLLLADRSIVSFENSAMARMSVFKISVGVGIDNFLTGVGPNQLLEITKRLTGLSSLAHNMLLELFVLAGAPGLIFMTYCYVTLLRSVGKTLIQGGDLLDLMTLVFVVVILFSGLFLSYFPSTLFFVPFVFRELSRVRQRTAHPA